MDQGKATVWKLLSDLAPGARELAGWRADAAALTALALDALLGLKEHHRVEVLGILAATTDIARRGSQAKERAESEAETHELALHGNT
jgi:hypothetical protein